MEDNNKVIDFGSARKAKIEERRRRYERVLFQKVLGAYVVAEGEGLKAVELVDLSLDGLSFQLPISSKNLEGITQGQEVIFRFYFSEDSYIPVGVKVMNQRPCLENGQKYVRFGCAIDTTMKSYGTYRSFVEFLSNYAEAAQQDTGDLKLFYF